MFSWRCCLVLILVWVCGFGLWLVSFVDADCGVMLFWFSGLLVGLLVVATLVIALLDCCWF